jgi:hypothetical protein
MIGDKSGIWKSCPNCDIYCELNVDGSCSECGYKKEELK